MVLLGILRFLMLLRSALLLGLEGMGKILYLVLLRNVFGRSATEI